MPARPLIPRAFFLALAFLSFDLSGAPYPDALDDWGIFSRVENTLALKPQNLPYQLEMASFSDYAYKLRSMRVPENTQLSWGQGAFEFPVGTVLSKTFFYPLVDGRPQVPAATDRKSIALASIDLSEFLPIETRLLVLEEHGWIPLTYMWEDGSANRSRFGGIRRVEHAASEDSFHYIAPSENECGACHVTDAKTSSIAPLGFKPRHLVHASSAAAVNHNQLENLAARSVLEDRSFATLHRLSDPDEHEARLYLDVNCAHCHNRRGHAQHINLDFAYEQTNLASLGICKDPVTYKRHRDEKVVMPGQIVLSSLLLRLNTVDHSIRMPPNGRHTIDRKGVELVRDWVAQLNKRCE